MFSFYNFCKQNITNFILSQRGKMELWGWIFSRFVSLQIQSIPATLGQALAHKNSFTFNLNNENISLFLRSTPKKAFSF